MLFRSLYAPTHEDLQLETVKRREASIGVAGFRQAWRTGVSAGDSVRCGDVTISLKDGALAFSTKQEQKPQEVPLAKVLNQKSAAQRERELPTETLTVDLPQGQPTFRLIFDRITFRRDAGDTRITGADFYLLEK